MDGLNDGDSDFEQTPSYLNSLCIVGNITNPLPHGIRT